MNFLTINSLIETAAPNNLWRWYTCLHQARAVQYNQWRGQIGQNVCVGHQNNIKLSDFILRRLRNAGFMRVADKPLRYWPVIRSTMILVHYLTQCKHMYHFLSFYIWLLWEYICKTMSEVYLLKTVFCKVLICRNLRYMPAFPRHAGIKDKRLIASNLRKTAATLYMWFGWHFSTLMQPSNGICILLK